MSCVTGRAIINYLERFAAAGGQQDNVVDAHLFISRYRSVDCVEECVHTCQESICVGGGGR